MPPTNQCPNCYNILPQHARFCTTCGTKVEIAPTHPVMIQETTRIPTSSPSGPGYISSEYGYISKEERDWAMYCHLSAMLVLIFPYAHIIAPLILWMMKRESSTFIDDQGKEALNYNLSIMIYLTIAGISSCLFIGVPVFVGLVLFDLVIMVVAGIQASKGIYYRYPITIRFIK